MAEKYIFVRKKAVSDRKLILVSNDDGVHARGLRYLVDLASQYGDVVVVAPELSQSGKSHSITLTSPLRMRELQSAAGLSVYAVSGTPVDCVKMALGKVCRRKPDLMLSGINHGSNSAISLIYSGTMGAAIEASMYGIPSVGLSVLDHTPEADFSIVTKYAPAIIDKVLTINTLPNLCLNINYPVIDIKDFRGYRLCSQTAGVWREEMEEQVDPYGCKYYWLTGYFDNAEPQNTNSDEWALKNNYAAIVPVKIDFTDHNQINELKKWNL